MTNRHHEILSKSVIQDYAWCQIAPYGQWKSYQAAVSKNKHKLPIVPAGEWELTGGHVFHKGQSWMEGKAALDSKAEQKRELHRRIQDRPTGNPPGVVTWWSRCLGRGDTSHQDEILGPYVFMYQEIVSEGRPCWRLNLFYYFLYFSTIGVGHVPGLWMLGVVLGTWECPPERVFGGPRSHGPWPPVAGRLSGEKGELTQRKGTSGCGFQPLGTSVSPGKRWSTWTNILGAGLEHPLLAQCSGVGLSSLEEPQHPGWASQPAKCLLGRGWAVSLSGKQSSAQHHVSGRTATRTEQIGSSLLSCGCGKLGQPTLGGTRTIRGGEVREVSIGKYWFSDNRVYVMNNYFVQKTVVR